jgi:predicted peroxiredoxin/TusA-related sulfurtransferase
MTQSQQPRETLDVRGKTITTYVAYEAATRLAEMADGGLLDLVVDDYQPFVPDIEAWCASAGHRLVGSEVRDDGRHFMIERGTPGHRSARMAMVISSDGLEELISPLGFALAAALEGAAVSLYFQGPAVRVLARGHRPALKGWARPFSRFASAGLARAGHIPPQDKVRQLLGLGARVYVCGPSMDHFKVVERDLAFDGLPVVEYLTFMAVMAQADVQLYV